MQIRKCTKTWWILCWIHEKICRPSFSNPSISIRRIHPHRPNEDGEVCVLPHPYTRQESSWRFILRFNLPFKCKWDSFKNATQSLRGGFALNISRWLASSKGANHFIMSDVHLISFTVLLHQLWQKYYCLWMQRKLLIGWNGNICYVF